MLGLTLESISETVFILWDTLDVSPNLNEPIHINFQIVVMQVSGFEKICINFYVTCNHMAFIMGQ